MTEDTPKRDNGRRLLRRRHVLGATGVGLTAALAGCGSSDDDEEDDTTDEKEDDEQQDSDDATSVVLPPDSSELFRDGEINEHNFAEGSFTEDDVGRPVSEFNLSHADTSSVEDMNQMLY